MNNLFKSGTDLVIGVDGTQFQKSATGTGHLVIVALNGNTVTLSDPANVTFNAMAAQAS